MDATCVIHGEKGIEVTHVSIPWSFAMSCLTVRDEEVASVVKAKGEVEVREEDQQQAMETD